MKDSLKLAINRRTLGSFIQNHLDHSPDGHKYRYNLQMHGRDVAQKKQEESWTLRVRAANRAQCDVYGNPLENNVPIITHVAVYLPNMEQVLYLPRPFRHHHLLRTDAFKELNITHGNKVYPDIQGFIKNGDEFVPRDVALEIATHANQLEDKVVHGKRLFSENLWRFYHDNSDEEKRQSNLQLNIFFLKPSDYKYGLKNIG